MHTDDLIIMDTLVSLTVSLSHSILRKHNYESTCKHNNVLDALQLYDKRIRRYNWKNIIILRD